MCQIHRNNPVAIGIRVQQPACQVENLYREYTFAFNIEQSIARIGVNGVE